MVWHYRQTYGWTNGRGASQYPHFFFKKRGVNNDQSFNHMLTNDIVSFVQLGPGLYRLFRFVCLCIRVKTIYIHPSYGLHVDWHVQIWRDNIGTIVEIKFIAPANGYNRYNFCYFCLKTGLVSTYWKCLIKTIPVSTHETCFGAKIGTLIH